jgi:hypothetical protein
MRFTELTNEQRRQFIDVVGIFAAWRDVRARLRAAACAG